jgi:hypothetical protein
VGIFRQSVVHFGKSFASTPFVFCTMLANHQSETAGKISDMANVFQDVKESSSFERIDVGLRPPKEGGA